MDALLELLNLSPTDTSLRCKVSPFDLQQRIKFLTKPEVAKLTSAVQEIFAEDDETLLHLLRPLSYSEVEESLYEDSLVRLLLQYDHLQKPLLESCLEKFGEVQDESQEERKSQHEKGGTSKLGQLLLQQIRFLDHIVDGKALSKQLLEAIETSSGSTKASLILVLPELLEDAQQEAIVPALHTILTEDSSVLLPVLETVGNLAVQPQSLEEITKFAASSLGSVEPEDIPVIVRYLLNSAYTENMQEIVRDLRSNLQLWYPEYSEDEDRKGSGSADSINTLVLAAVRSAIERRVDVAMALLQEIAKGGPVRQEKYTAIDIWYLIILKDCSPSSVRIRVDATFRKLVDTGMIHAGLFAEALFGQKVPLTPFIDTLLYFSRILMRGKSPRHRELGSSLLVIIFHEFDELSMRQEVVNILTGIISAHDVVAADAGLAVLYALTSSPSLALRLRPFLSFLKSLLDNLEGMEANHVMALFDILFAVAMSSSYKHMLSHWADPEGAEDGAPPSSMQADADVNELTIILRKQLYNPNALYRRFGVYAHIAYLRILGNPLMSLYAVPPKIAEKAVRGEVMLDGQSAGSGFGSSQGLPSSLLLPAAFTEAQALLYRLLRAASEGSLMTPIALNMAGALEGTIRTINTAVPLPLWYCCTGDIATNNVFRATGLQSGPENSSGRGMRSTPPSFSQAERYEDDDSWDPASRVATTWQNYPLWSRKRKYLNKLWERTSLPEHGVPPSRLGIGQWGSKPASKLTGPRGSLSDPLELVDAGGAWMWHGPLDQALFATIMRDFYPVLEQSLIPTSPLESLPEGEAEAFPHIEPGLEFDLNGEDSTSIVAILRHCLGPRDEPTLPIPMSQSASMSLSQRVSAPSGTKFQVTIAHLIPLVYVTIAWERLKDGTEADMSPILASPFEIFRGDNIVDYKALSTDEQWLVCSTLLHTVNWIRGCLNLFLPQGDEEVDRVLQALLLLRLEHLVTVEERLIEAVLGCDDFHPLLWVKAELAKSGDPRQEQELNEFLLHKPTITTVDTQTEAMIARYAAAFARQKDMAGAFGQEEEEKGGEEEAQEDQGGSSEEEQEADEGTQPAKRRRVVRKHRGPGSGGNIASIKGALERKDRTKHFIESSSSLTLSLVAKSFLAAILASGAGSSKPTRGGLQPRLPTATKAVGGVPKSPTTLPIPPLLEIAEINRGLAPLSLYLSGAASDVAAPLRSIRNAALDAVQASQAAVAPESPEAGLIVSLFKILKDQLERTTPSITTAAIDFINGEGKKKKRSSKGGAVGRDNGTIVSAHDSFGNSASVAGGGSEVALLDLLRAISGEAAEAEVVLSALAAKASTTVLHLLSGVPDVVSFVNGLQCLVVLAFVRKAAERTESIPPAQSTARALLTQTSHAALTGFQREWGRQKIPSKVLQDLLQLNLVTAPSTLTAATSFLETILEPLAESLSNRGSGPPLPEYPCVSKSSFPSLYAATWRQALASFRTIITSASDIVAGPPAPSDVLQKMLAKLEKANRVFGRLVLLTKAADKRAVLISALDNGNRFVQLFLKVLPFLTQTVVVHPSLTVNVLKVLQQSTRQLQHISAHGKVAGDSQMMKAIPSLKKGLESLVFKVREMAASHGLLDAFAIGNLRNRSVDGSEVFSSNLEMLVAANADPDDQGDDGDSEDEQSD